MLDESLFIDQIDTLPSSYHSANSVMQSRQKSNLWHMWIWSVACFWSSCIITHTVSSVMMVAAVLRRVTATVSIICLIDLTEIWMLLRHALIQGKLWGKISLVLQNVKRATLPHWNVYALKRKYAPKCTFYLFMSLISPSIVCVWQVSSDVLHVWISVSGLHHPDCDLLWDDHSPQLFPPVCRGELTVNTSSVCYHVIRIGSYHVANIYKPPSETCGTTNTLPVLPHPSLLVGDFNSHPHHPDWGYQEPDEDGKMLQDCFFIAHANNNNCWSCEGSSGCKNRPAPFPGRMSYKTTKPGSVCPVSYPRFLMMYVLCCWLGTLFRLLFFMLFVCSVAWLFLLRCQYQCKWLTGKTRLWNDLKCVDGDVKPYSLTHSLTHSLTGCSFVSFFLWYFFHCL